VNSDAGVVGNIVVDERNFDWTRLPTSWEDVRNGSAFRGAGQRFRIDAAPGSEVNRYLVSFQEPYLMDRPISLGLSGSYFDRRFDDWKEQRLGGRISLGHQWVERDLSATISYRGENVEIYDPVATALDDPNTPAIEGVPELQEVVGDNSLHGFRVAVINDTRDSAFLATQGHYLEIGGEQVIGTFDYPRVDLDFRQYWKLYERPDHSGRHVLSYSTTIGFTGTHTPIYEHFFAGGFATMRGFDFRGASPMRNGIELGGEFQWLNSVQYLFPVTADDMLHGVAFVDFGTVEENVTINDFRVAPGLGLRITVPAMGPAPIALDFAYPVSHADFDDTEIFSFSLGFSR
jgi:outer membrane protein insertion porin family